MEKGWNLANIWKDYSPPGRPSEKELDIFDYYIENFEKVKNSQNSQRELCMKSFQKSSFAKLSIKKIKPSSALILGSTPEFRMLLHKYKVKTTVADYSKETYKILSKLVKNIRKETFINCDWRKIKSDKKYDLILGDLSINCIPKKDIPKMMRLLAKIVSNNGLIIQRIAVRKDNKKKTIKKIIEDYRKNCQNCSTWQYIWFDVQINSYDFKKEYMLFSDALKNMIKANKQGIMKDSELKPFLNKAWENLTALKWFIPKIDYIKKEINKSLKIISIEYSKDIFSKDMPVFIMRKR